MIDRLKCRLYSYLLRWVCGQKQGLLFVMLFNILKRLAEQEQAKGMEFHTIGASLNLEKKRLRVMVDNEEREDEDDEEEKGGEA